MLALIGGGGGGGWWRDVRGLITSTIVTLGCAGDSLLQAFVDHFSRSASLHSFGGRKSERGFGLTMDADNTCTQCNTRVQNATDNPQRLSTILLTMDLEKLSNDGKVSLLTLPRADLKPPESSSSTLSSSPDDDDNHRHNHQSNAIKKTTEEDRLMLLQLPLGWTVEDLKKDSHFVANQVGDQATLVCNSKQTSFALQHVETSNCLIMVPPLRVAATAASSMTATTTTTTTEQEEPLSEESPTKKAKTTDSSSSSSDKLRTVPSRLLKAGGSGASFLGLHPKTLRLADLKFVLSKSCMLDPYNNNNDDNNNKFPPGRSIDSLAHELQQSQAEIQQGLQRLQGAAFCVRNDTDGNQNYYCLLSEEVQLIVHHAIISTLAEADEFDDYATTGVPVDTFCQITKERMSEEERFDGIEKVIRQLLLELANEKATSTRSVVKPVVSKVRLCVAVVCHVR